MISGNHHTGVEISHGTGTINNQVIGNFIGTDPTGNGASAQTVNNVLGVRLEGAPDCNNKPCPSDASHEIVTDNVIVNSGWGGIFVDKGVHDSVIANNRIGVTLNGTVVGNTGFGIRLAAGATHITVGPGNIIAGDHAGIQISPLGYDPASSVATVTQYNTITQNSITTPTPKFGIDLYPWDTVNQNGNGGPSTNQRIDIPVLAMQSGQVTASTCAGCIVEVFGTAGAANVYGPGNVYVGTATADGSGRAVLAAPAGGWPKVLTATTRTPQGSTSEFSANVLSGSNAPPIVDSGPPALTINGSATASVPAQRLPAG